MFLRIISQFTSNNIRKTPKILVLMIFLGCGANNIANFHEAEFTSRGIRLTFEKFLRKMHHLFHFDCLFSEIPNRTFSWRKFMRKRSRLLRTIKSQVIIIMAEVRKISAL